MYHYESSSWIDGTDVHPDALLSSGGAFVPTGHQQQQQQQQENQLTPGMTSFRRAMSTRDLTFMRQAEEEEEQPRVVAPPVRYSAEERRERIDKYRSKRNQRNFQKKITYACRKTLADSRPRVKGRFARSSGENCADQEGEIILEGAGLSVSESPSVNDVVITGNGTNRTSMPEYWWLEMQEALVTDVDMDNLCDEELLAAYLGVSSISLCSPSSTASGQ